MLDTPMEEVPAEPLIDPLYQQCASARAAASARNVMHVAGTSFGSVEIAEPDKLGSLLSDSTGTFHGSRLTHMGTPVNQTISVSFDPANLSCIKCNPEHKIALPGKPLIICLYDQNFVPSFDSVNTKSCIAVARMEDATLLDLGTFALELFDKVKPPPGSIFMIGSATHLVRAGATRYAKDWTILISRLKSSWPDSQCVPLFPIPRDNCDTSLSRDIAELTHWLVTVYKGCNLGLTKAWSTAARVLCNLSSGETPLEKPETYVLAFPSTLDPDCPLQSFTFRTTSSRPTNLTRPSVETTSELVLGLVNNLTSSLRCDLSPEDFSPREPQATHLPATKPCAQSIILVGASNLRATSDSLRGAGYLVYDVTTPGWVASPAKIKLMTENLANVSADKTVPVVLDLFSNSAFRFTQYDGTPSLPQQSKNGYHLPGDVILAENGVIIRLIELLKPILEIVGDRDKIFIPPLPRYIVSGCCQNIEHCTNRKNPNYGESILKELTRVQNCMKKELRAAGVSRYWVLGWDSVLGDPAGATVAEQLASLSGVSACDGVHFNTVGKNNMTVAIHKTVTSMNDGSLVSSRGTAQKKFFWRGFVSGEGSRAHAEAKRFQSGKGKGHLRLHPYSR